MEENTEITLNNKKLTESEFVEKKEELEKKKGVKVVETGINEYKTRLQE